MSRMKWVECIYDTSDGPHSKHQLTVGKIYQVIEYHNYTKGDVSLDLVFIRVESDAGEEFNFKEFHFKDVTLEIERDNKLNKLL